MKNKKLHLILAITFLLQIFIPVFGNAVQPIKLLINNKYVQSDVEPFIENSRTMVPLRVISENLGIPVKWDNDTRQVILNKENTEIKYYIDKQYYTVGDKKQELDVAPKIVNSRTFVPIRAIAETFNKEVGWDNDNRTVIIGSTEIKTANNFQEAKVVRVVDGDTIVANVNGQNKKIRLILVNTPETKHPKKGVEYYGKEASEYTTKELSNKTIYLQKDVSDTDKYGRLLRYVWLTRPSTNNPSNEEITNNMFNARLLKNGYANLSTFPPDIKYVNLFRELEKEARDKGIGLWQNGNTTQEQSKTSKQSNIPTTTDGRIKGNIKSKIYHLPGDKYYNRIKESNIRYFDSESEAQVAGYRHSKI